MRYPPAAPCHSLVERYHSISSSDISAKVTLFMLGHVMDGTIIQRNPCDHLVRVSAERFQKLSRLVHILRFSVDPVFVYYNRICGKYPADFLFCRKFSHDGINFAGSNIFRRIVNLHAFGDGFVNVCRMNDIRNSQGFQYLLSAR